MRVKNFRKYQQGMTLIELIIVVVVVGGLAIVGAKAFSNANISDTSKAQALFEGCSKLSQNLVLLANEAGQGSQVTGSALPLGSGNYTTVLDVLYSGTTAMAVAYQSAWTRAGLSQLTDVIKGSAGAYTMAGYSLTFGGGGTTAHSCQVTVPDSLAGALVQKYGAGTAPTVGTATDTTNATIQYQALSGGNRVVTILRPL